MSRRFYGTENTKEEAGGLIDVPLGQIVTRHVRLQGITVGSGAKKYIQFMKDRVKHAKLISKGE